MKVTVIRDIIPARGPEPPSYRATLWAVFTDDEREMRKAYGAAPLVAALSRCGVGNTLAGINQLVDNGLPLQNDDLYRLKQAEDDIIEALWSLAKYWDEARAFPGREERSLP